MKTDWDRYYAKPGRLTRFTRPVTCRKLLAALDRYRGEVSRARVLELGGGNSGFFDAVWERLRPAAYTIVDDNPTGLTLFAESHPGLEGVTLRAGDVTHLPPPEPDELHDICFSVGLIEHFDRPGTRAAVEAHFRCVRPGGLVVLFFPTPTWLYRVIRRAAEVLGIWEFPDERPLTLDEVREALADRGRVIDCGVNWWIGLTQAFVVAEVRS